MVMELLKLKINLQSKFESKRMKFNSTDFFLESSSILGVLRLILSFIDPMLSLYLSLFLLFMAVCLTFFFLSDNEKSQYNGKKQTF
jgi:hypothetical protein